MILAFMFFLSLLCKIVNVLYIFSIKVGERSKRREILSFWARYYWGDKDLWKF